MSITIPYTSNYKQLLEFIDYSFSHQTLIAWNV